MPDFRQRYLFLKNRLEELAAKHGPLVDPEPESAELDPSWGPLGSLAKRSLDEEEFQHLLRLHADAIRLERSRRDPPPEEPEPTPPPAPPRATPRPRAAPQRELKATPEHLV